MRDPSLGGQNFSTPVAILFPTPVATLTATLGATRVAILFPPPWPLLRLPLAQPPWLPLRLSFSSRGHSAATPGAIPGFLGGEEHLGALRLDMVQYGPIWYQI